MSLLLEPVDSTEAFECIILFPVDYRLQLMLPPKCHKWVQVGLNKFHLGSLPVPALFYPCRATLSKWWYCVHYFPWWMRLSLTLLTFKITEFYKGKRVSAKCQLIQWGWRFARDDCIMLANKEIVLASWDFVTRGLTPNPTSYLTWTLRCWTLLDANTSDLTDWSLN